MTHTTHTSPPHPEEAKYVPPCTLVPASHYTVAELTEAYNQTRVDYIVPMPMNVARLQAYIDHYDVDLTRSVVALDGEQMLGLAMLGVRPGRTWITRLGVLPNRRGRGTGEAMMRYLLQQSRDLGSHHVILEVIKNNVPAHRLFRKLGFHETRELLILRRPPGMPQGEVPPYEALHRDEEASLALLRQRRSVPSWLDDYPSLRNAGGLACIQVELQDGGRGWLVYQVTVFQLARLVLQTERGDATQVTRALLHALHTHYPALDTKTENLPADDPHLQGMLDMGYVEVFRRIEMHLSLCP